MSNLILKAALSGVLVALISEIARRSPGFGALIASLPLVSLLAMIWLWRDTGDRARIADHAQATFWLVLPSLPMFLILPWMPRRGWDFFLALGLASAATVVLYFFMLRVLPRLGIEI
tara:strand:- start:3225 stop:3575 length:351 start_codon:yes stop_codon:yes gene_type:complete